MMITPQIAAPCFTVDSAGSHKRLHLILIKTMWKGQDAYYYPHFIDEKAEFPSKTGFVGREFYRKLACTVRPTRTAMQPRKQTVVTLLSPVLQFSWIECRC